MHFVLSVQMFIGMSTYPSLQQLRSKTMFMLLMPRILNLILTVGSETFLRLWIQSPITRVQMSSSLMAVAFFSLEMKVITVMNSETLSIMKKPSACCCALHLTKLPPSAPPLKRWAFCCRSDILWRCLQALHSNWGFRVTDSLSSFVVNDRCILGMGVGQQISDIVGADSSAWALATSVVPLLSSSVDDSFVQAMVESCSLLQIPVQKERLTETASKSLEKSITIVK